jgi:putative aminopeptidase FrvX
LPSGLSGPITKFLHCCYIALPGPTIKCGKEIHQAANLSGNPQEERKVRGSRTIGRSHAMDQFVDMIVYVWSQNAHKGDRFPTLLDKGQAIMLKVTRIHELGH